MAIVFRRTRRYPIPRGATITTNRGGERFAKWTDAKGRTRRERLNAAGECIIVPARTCTIAYTDENGRPQAVNSRTPDRDVAEQIANKIESDVALRRRGIVTAEQEQLADAGSTLGGLPSGHGGSGDNARACHADRWFRSRDCGRGGMRQPD